MTREDKEESLGSDDLRHQLGGGLRRGARAPASRKRKRRAQRGSGPAAGDTSVASLLASMGEEIDSEGDRVEPAADTDADAASSEESSLDGDEDSSDSEEEVSDEEEEPAKKGKLLPGGPPGSTPGKTARKHTTLASKKPRKQPAGSGGSETTEERLNRLEQQLQYQSEIVASQAAELRQLRGDDSSEQYVPRSRVNQYAGPGKQWPDSRRPQLFRLRNCPVFDRLQAESPDVLSPKAQDWATVEAATSYAFDLGEFLHLTVVPALKKAKQKQTASRLEQTYAALFSLLRTRREVIAENLIRPPEAASKTSSVLFSLTGGFA